MHGFSLLWVIAFLLGASHFIMAGSASIWYFNRNDYDKPNSLLKSIYWLVRYHIGSVAFAGLILAIVWAIRIIINTIQVWHV